jgi:choline kinase
MAMTDNVRAVVLCAGAGLRLAEVTRGRPKSFLQVGDESLIQRQIRLLRQSGLVDVTLVVGFMSELFEAEFKGCSFVHNRDFRTTNTAHSLLLALSGRESKSVLVLNGDVYFEEDVIPSMLDHPGGTVAALDRKRIGEEEIKVFIEGDRITAIGKHLNEELSAGEAFGVYKLSPAFARYLARELGLQNNPRAFYENAMDRLLSGGHAMSFYDIGDGLAMEIDTPEDYQELVNKLKPRR